MATNTDSARGASPSQTDNARAPQLLGAPNSSNGVGGASASVSYGQCIKRCHAFDPDAIVQASLSGDVEARQNAGSSAALGGNGAGIQSHGSSSMGIHSNLLITSNLQAAGCILDCVQPETPKIEKEFREFASRINTTTSTVHNSQTHGPRQ